MKLSFQPTLSANIRYVQAGVRHTAQYNSDAVVNESLSVAFVNTDGVVSIQATLKQAMQVELLTVSLHIAKQGAVTCSDRHYKQTTVASRVWNNDLTPIHISYTDGGRQYTLRHHHRMCSHAIADDGNYLTLTLYIDAAAAHPKWSYETQKQLPAALPVLPAGHTYRFSFAVAESSNYPILCRYPNGAEAAFLIIDHCDFDDTARLQTFLKDWLGKGLKMTKGVFSLRSPKPDPKYAPTLQDAAYNALITQLHNDGSEIAPHAFNQSSQISATQFKNALQHISERYQPSTWIDHGSYLKYCYYMGAAHNPDYKLLEALSAKGFTAIWSFNDAAQPAHQTLNLLATAVKPKAIVRKKLLKGELSIAMHYFKKHMERSSSANSITVKLGRLATTIKHFLYDKRKLRLKTYTTFLKHIAFSFRNVPEAALPYTGDELKHIAPVLFPEHGAPMHQYRQGDMLLFNTQEVVQLDEAYTPQALQQLKAEHGLHIGHTYLLNKLPYVKGVFNKDNSLAKYWTDFTAYLSNEVSQGNIWNPTMAEFTEYIVGLHRITITYPAANVMRIHNGSDKDVKGLSFRMPEGSTLKLQTGSAVISGKATFDGLMAWIDVSAGETVKVVW